MAAGIDRSETSPEGTIFVVILDTLRIVVSPAALLDPAGAPVPPCGEVNRRRAAEKSRARVSDALIHRR